MLDFTIVSEKRLTLAEMANELTPRLLGDFTNEMIDKMLDLLVDCVDADVIFYPDDPNAFDRYTDNAAETEMAWTLAHVIVHTTASAEESAFLAAEMARGVGPHGRSRFEVDWETVTTIAGCRARLAESRRMRLSLLASWPEKPHLEITYTPWPQAGEVNAVGRFVLGLWHDADHLDQIEDFVSQAIESRSG